MTMLTVAIMVGVGLVLVLQVVALVRGGGGALEAMSKRLDVAAQVQERADKALRDDLQQLRNEARENAQMLRQEVQDTLLRISESSQKSVRELGVLQLEQFAQFSVRLDTVGTTVEARLEGIRTTLVENLTLVRSDNEKKLEQMRVTVDEKLQGTLDRRLGESFKQVSDKLEQVHRGLGEMQVLTNGVGDLKKVLTNVKARGTWGEVQLGNLLQEILTEQQYGKNIETRFGSGERVEYAVKLPGNNSSDEPVWLPIDSKFPVEDYQRLVDAADAGDAVQVEASAKALEASAKLCAKTIREKYVNPPATTDFAMMFLPTEGLYAEVLRRPGLSELLQREMRVIVAGPTTLCAILNSLQMGFRTLAIEKRSSEVWTTLGAVKTEFQKFGDALDGVKKKLEAASKSIDTVEVRSRVIERKLRDVEELSGAESPALLRDATAISDSGIDEGIVLDPEIITDVSLPLLAPPSAIS